MATKGRVAAWPLSDSRDRKGRFTSSTGGSGVAGTAACSRGRSAPATPRDVADRTGAKGPERAATDNMATAAPNTKPVTGTTFRSNAGAKRRGRRRTCDVSAPPEKESRRDQRIGRIAALEAWLRVPVGGGAGEGGAWRRLVWSQCPKKARIWKNFSWS